MKSETAQAASEDHCGTRVLLTYDAGYEGFWLARRLKEEPVEVIVCDPASLEVVRRKKKAKTNQIDARKMARALNAWDGGGRNALSPVWNLYPQPWEQPVHKFVRDFLGRLIYIT